MTFRLPMDLKTALVEAADVERRSLAQLCMVALETYLEAHHEYRRPRIHPRTKRTPKRS